MALRFAPTSALHEEYRQRPGVRSRFLYPGEREIIEVKGVCWLTIDES